MILDSRLEFADAVSVAAAAGTALIGYQIDTAAVHRDIGHGQPLWLVIMTAVEIITGGSAGTIKFQLASDASAAVAVDGSATVHIDTGTFVTDGTDANAAQLKAGETIFAGQLPQEGAVYERYLGLLCIIATTTVTQGSINAFITSEQPYKHDYYNDAVN